MNIVSWNINGLKSCLKKGLLEFIKEDNSEIYCFQESKISNKDFDDLQNGLFPVFSEFYAHNFESTKRKGYSGLTVLSKEKPLSVVNGLGEHKFDQEARAQIVELATFYLLNTYFPHPKEDLSRLDYKMEFCKSILDLANDLKRTKPVMIVGDFNVAHTPKDLFNSNINKMTSKFTETERNWFEALLNNGYVDSFRRLYPDRVEFSWFAYSKDDYQKRRNLGWRLDYCVVSADWENKLVDCTHLKDVGGSDHVPVKLELKHF